MIENAMVVLSGGFDSTALLHWALEKYADVAAVSFDYGQPHREAELAAAERVARKRLRADVWERVRLTELGPLDPEPGTLAPGVARAVVPGRNLVLLSYAANRAARRWFGQDAIILYGANKDDGEGFADCRPAFVERASAVIAAAYDGLAQFGVSAPWVELGWSKVDILRWVRTRPEALLDVRTSVSCYRGVRCGACDSCARRTKAFSVLELEDDALSSH
jgi:7-cyano-7-deazaguanine synthase